MIPPRDQISRPKLGRFFPFSVVEILAKIKEQAFKVHIYDKRLPILFQNCEVKCQFGHQLASFLRMNYLSVFSLPEFVNENSARRALEHAIVEFARIDRRPHLATRDQQLVVYRAYLGTLNTISITQDVVNAGNRSYLLSRKISKVSRSQSRPHNEILLVSTKLAKQTNQPTQLSG